VSEENSDYLARASGAWFRWNQSVNAALMITCLGDAFFPDVGVATVTLLRRLGVTVTFPDQQTCCGQPHFNSGFPQDSRELAKHAMRTFANAELVVTPSGSCAAMVKLEYPHLFEHDAVWKPRADALAAKTHELSSFLVNVLKVDDVGARFNGRVTYHMACHLRGLGLGDNPVRLIKRVAGLTFVPLDRFDECCGFGGSFAVRYPGISGAMVNDKARTVAAANVDAVVSTDAGCLMNIGGCLRRHGTGPRILHLAELLAST
jgi:L-lactate dehydrogenase complex protein LldE